MRIVYHFSADGETPPSRRRSLLRDLADGLLQQMYLWGCDVRCRQGNLLVIHGMQRIERADIAKSEGTSRYRMPWEGGVVELHGSYASWSAREVATNGILFVRHRRRLFLCNAGEPVTPGEYEGIGGGNTDALFESAMPFVRVAGGLRKLD